MVADLKTSKNGHISRDFLGICSDLPPPPPLIPMPSAHIFINFQNVVMCHHPPPTRARTSLIFPQPQTPWRGEWTVLLRVGGGGGVYKCWYCAPSPRHCAALVAPPFPPPSPLRGGRICWAPRGAGAGASHTAHPCPRRVVPQPPGALRLLAYGLAGPCSGGSVHNRVSEGHVRPDFASPGGRV